LFLSTFFDVGSMSRIELKLFVERHVKNIATRAAGGDIDAARRAVRGDARILALTMAGGTLAWRAVLLQLGWQPPRVELEDVVGRLEQLSVTRIGQAMLRNFPNDSRQAERYANVLQKLREVHAGVARPEAELVRKLSVIRLRTSDQSIPHIDTLAGAEDRTVDVVPAQNNGDEPADDDLEKDIELGVGTPGQ
jgi:hypothetical protein